MDKLDTSVLLPGAKLIVETANTTYTIEFVDPAAGEILLRGGNRWPFETPMKFIGSTDGNELFPGTITPGMSMRVARGNSVFDVVTTSPVRLVKVAE